MGTIPALQILLQGISGTLPIELVIILVLLAAFGIAAELINRGTERFEKVVGQGMAGGVILGFMSSLPELIFVLVAIGKGSASVALGSAIGGNIILFTIGIGVVGITYFMKWKKPLKMKDDYKTEVLFLLVSNLSLILLVIYGKLDYISGVLLLLIYAIYLAYRYMHAHSRTMASLRTKKGRRAALGGIVYFSTGIIVVTILSDVFIHYIITFAGMIGVSALFLSIVITPIAADLPEQLSAYRMSVSSEGGGSTALVGFIGSKLQNNTVLLGAIGILSAVTVRSSSSLTAFLLVIGINFIAIATIYRGTLTFRNGVFLAALYFIAVATAFIV